VKGRDSIGSQRPIANRPADSIPPTQANKDSCFFSSLAAFLFSGRRRSRSGAFDPMTRWQGTMIGIDFCRRQPTARILRIVIRGELSVGIVSPYGMLRSSTPTIWRGCLPIEGQVEVAQLAWSRPSTASDIAERFGIRRQSGRVFDPFLPERDSRSRSSPASNSGRWGLM